MNKLRRTMLFLFSLFPLIISSCNDRYVNNVLQMECIRSFDDFAYSLPESNPNARTETILPPSPWEVEAAVPTQQIAGYYPSTTVDVEIARSIQGHQEIWLIENLSPVDSSQSLTNVFLVYQPGSQGWKLIPSNIGNTGFFVGSLFVTSDGNLWGTTVWDTIHGQPKIENVPVLSKFNEDTQRFEFATGAPEISSTMFSNNFFPWPEIVLDDKNIFWIFTKNNGLYRYDPAVQRTEKQADLSGLNVTRAALSPDGSIFFEVYSEKVYSKESFFRLSDGILFQFTPATKQIAPLNIPNQSWPIFSGMLVDHNGRLWLGAIGYKEPSGDWHLVDPNPQEYFEHAGDIYWISPTLILESSSGILWYKKLLDDVRVDGTAWYDPKTGKGCMFTNVAANIIEDSEQQLWLAAAGKLFKYSLNH